MSALLVCGCTFDLADMETTPGKGSDASAPDAAVDHATGLDADPIDAAEEFATIDGCWPPSDAAFCASHGFVCGTLDATDECGQARSVNCGGCSVDAHCAQGACINYVYSWHTGDWSSCSAPCGGGTQTRTVWCEREDGTTVNDSKCGGSKPDASTACNTQACQPPTGPVVVDPPLVSDTQIGLSWQPVADATEYAVLWSSVLGDGVDSVTTTWFIIDTDTSLDHWVSIYACNSAGCGDPAQFGPIKK